MVYIVLFVAHHHRLYMNFCGACNDYCECKHAFYVCQVCDTGLVLVILNICDGALSTLLHLSTQLSM